MHKQPDKIPEKFMMLKPPAGLLDKVMQRIDEEKSIASLKKRLALFSIFLAISAAVSFPLWQTLRVELIQSGFSQYLTLLIYDSRAVAAYWQDFSLTLLETLPAVTLTGALFVIFVILASLRMVVRDGQTLIKMSRAHSP